MVDCYTVVEHELLKAKSWKAFIVKGMSQIKKKNVKGKIK